MEGNVVSFRKWRSAVAVAFTLLLTTALTPPANAAEQGRICHDIVLSDGTKVRFCLPIIIHKRLVLVDCPPICGVSLHWRLDYRIYPETGNTINDRISNGLRLLGQAAHTTSPTSRAQWENEAAQSFGAAVRANGGYRFEVDSVGVVQAANQAYQVRRDLPWLTAAAEDVVEGVRLAQQPGPSPQPGTAAMAKFKEAYQELSLQTVIDGPAASVG
jgi:hypothetical protein